MNLRKRVRINIKNNCNTIMKLVYPAIFKLRTKISEGYDVVIPDLKDCFAEGKSLADAIYNATEEASAWILRELQKGNTVPNASVRSKIQCQENEFVNILVLNIDEYAEKHGDKAVRKNLTIPAWLNTFVEKKHINCSWVLQNELVKLWKIAQSQTMKTKSE